MTHILIATLGISPQVVTISIDLLARRGYRIGEVVTIYSSNPRVDAAVERLAEALHEMRITVHRPIKVIGEQGVVNDIRNEADIAAFLKIIYREVQAYKRAGHQLHLLIAGGRKVMSAYALVVAQLLFDEADYVWHLFSEAWERTGDTRMHLDTADEAALIPIPIIRWTSMTPAAMELVLSDDPWQALNQQEKLQQRERDLRLGAFLRGLSPAHRSIIQLLATGLDNASIAKQRSRSINTVTKQVAAIYDQWRTFFGLPNNAYVRDQIISEMATFFLRYKDF